MKVYYHPRDSQDMRRVHSEFCDAVMMSKGQPIRGVLLHGSPDSPWRRGGYQTAGGVYVTGNHPSPGVVEIGIPDERAIADHEIEADGRCRRWCVPARWLNEQLALAKAGA